MPSLCLLPNVVGVVGRKWTILFAAHLDRYRPARINARRTADGVSP